MHRFSPQQGFLVSAIVHLALIMLLVNRIAHAPAPKRSPTPFASPREVVFMPPAEVLRQILRRPASPPPPDAVPTPAPPPPRDRISIGPPSDRRAEQLLLRREDDLTAVPKGRPDATGGPPPSPRPEPTTPRPPAAASSPMVADGAAGPLRLPPGLGRPEPPGRDVPGTGGSPRPLSESLRNLDRRIADGGARGLETGTGEQIGPLFFDPQGADFTAWINHFKNEVYRNWIVPQPALLGVRGHVDIEFTVERDGRLTNLSVVKSAGNPALDRAAVNALRGGRFLPLPGEYGPDRVPMQVSFFYNDVPQGS